MPMRQSFLYQRRYTLVQLLDKGAAVSARFPKGTTG